MKRCQLILLVALTASLLSSCLKNDIPYPRIQANFLTFSVKDQGRASTIDSATRVIDIVLNEQADIYNVEVTGYSITPGSHVADGDLAKPIDLSRPYAVMLRYYQDYWWVIRATQDINRYFTVSGQIGSSIIDVPAHRVVVTLPESMNLSNVKVTSVKLGAEGSTTTPDLNGATIDLNRPVTLTVTTHGRSEEWNIYADLTQSTVTTEGVDAWTRVAWLHGQAEEGKDNGFEYRRKASGA